MKGQWIGSACNLTYEPGNGDRLLSPDGALQLLPCDRCGSPKWVAHSVVAFTCTVCTDELQDGMDWVQP